MPVGGYGRVGAISDYPTFAGMVGEDLDTFFIKLKRRLELKNIDPELWGQVGVECLTGTAAVWAESHEFGRGVGEWERLKLDLRSRFLDMGAKDRRLNEFLHIVRGSDESLDAFVSRFQSVLGKALPSLGAAHDVVALSTLKSSVKDPDACVRILEHERRHGPSLQNAYVLLTEFGQAHARARETARVPRTATVPVTAIEPRAFSETRSPSPSRNREHPKCYTCGGMGHMSRECPTPRGRSAERGKGGKGGRGGKGRNGNLSASRSRSPSADKRWSTYRRPSVPRPSMNVVEEQPAASGDGKRR